MGISILIIMLFLIGMLCFVLYHFFIQQSLRDINNRLALLQPVPPQKRNTETIRRERAHYHDQLTLLEADLVNNTRESLETFELQSIDKARQVIKNCIEELKLSGEWMGIPFDFEWTEILDRLPILNKLYRKSIAEMPAVDENGLPLAQPSLSEAREIKR